MSSSSDNVYLITNRHNVTGRHQETGECLSVTAATPTKIEISHFVSNQRLALWSEIVDVYDPYHVTDEILALLKARITTIEPLYDEENCPLWYEHPTLGHNADMVAVRLTNRDGIFTNLFQRNFSKPLAMQVTETVSVIGYPFGKSNNNFPVWTNGTLASDPILNYTDLPILLIDSPSRSGQSGSPVFRHVTSGVVGLETGNAVSVTSPMSRFIGIYSGRIDSDSTIGMVWKAHAVYELIDSLP